MDVWVRTKTEGANFLRPHIYCLLCSVCGNFSWPHMYPLPEQYMRKLLLTAFLPLALFCMRKLLLTVYLPLAHTEYEETSPDRILTPCPYSMWGNFFWQHIYRLLCSVCGNFSWPHTYRLPIQYMRKLLLTAYLPLALHYRWKLYPHTYCLYVLLYIICQNFYRPHSTYCILTANSIGYAETSTYCMLTAIVGHNFC